MALVMLIIGCIAITVGLAGTITCIKDALSLSRSIRERDEHEQEAR